MIGKTISHYKILEKLGEGGMGVVYKAEDLKLKRTVALKFLPPELTRDPEAKERFIQEAQAASALDHPNICTIHEIDETEDGQMFIVMACYEGETLKKKVISNQLSVDSAIDFAIQIAQGLAKAHEHGITHRDIKPANVMITKDGVVKILDFGLAKLAGQTGLTRAGTTLGTVAYMSPEQAQGEVVDQRTDIWSLGVVLYEMLTGQLPFKGEYEQAVIYSILNEIPESIINLNSAVPIELERSVNLCLAKNAADRYQQTTDLLADLRSLKSQLESGVSHRPRFQIPPARRTLLYVFSAVLVVLVLLAGYFLFRPKAVSVDRKSIAVLPFTNLSESKEDEFFSDGITEDILTQLSKIADLRVISRTSVMQYKGTKKKIREISKELNVATILEGSVRRAENQVRIVAQLIDAHNDEHLWAETYDKEFTHIFAIQSDVAQKIAQALQARLSPMEKERIEKTPTANLTAYEYYLRGRDYYYHYIKQDNETAIGLFKNALALDPNYALAWAGLGDAYAQRFGRFAYEIFWLDSAITVSNKAIALDPNSAEGFKALGTAYFYQGRFSKELEALRQAVEHNPNYYPAIANLGALYYERGALDEALYWLKKALVLSPTFPYAYCYIGETYRQLDEPLEAEPWLNQAIELKPDDYESYYYLALLYLGKGQDQQAAKQVEKELAQGSIGIRDLEWAARITEFTDNLSAAKQYYQKARQENASFETDPRALSAIGLGHILLQEGQQQEAYQLLDLALSARIKAIEAGSEYGETFYYTAAIYAIRNNKAEAYQWLQKAIEVGWRDYRTTERDPWFENLRGDDQFKQMMAQVKKQVAEMRKRVQDMEKE
jgi:serine/threonine protein kinase/Tfp pilus assembly protein PilF